MNKVKRKGSLWLWAEAKWKIGQQQHLSKQQLRNMENENKKSGAKYPLIVYGELPVGLAGFPPFPADGEQAITTPANVPPFDGPSIKIPQGYKFWWAYARGAWVYDSSGVATGPAGTGGAPGAGFIIPSVPTGCLVGFSGYDNIITQYAHYNPLFDQSQQPSGWLKRVYVNNGPGDLYLGFFCNCENNPGNYPYMSGQIEHCICWRRLKIPHDLPANG
jgi:hypothetical protein